MKRCFKLLSAVLSLAFLIGCNRPASPTEEALSLDAMFTVAAQTVIAQMTVEAVPSQPAGALEEGASTPPPPEPTSTPPPSVTITPAQSPTPTETPTEVLQALYEDDFSTPGRWYTAEEDRYGFEYLDGAYRIYNNILNAAIWSIQAWEYTDVRVEVDAKHQGGPEDGYFGVVCRFHDDGANYYALVISMDGTYGILRMKENKVFFLATGEDQQEVIRRGDGEANRIAGVCSGDTLTLIVNGEEVLQVEDDDFRSGNVGLVAGNRMTAEGIDIVFDNFAIFMP